jgi:hypothetical protein
MNNNEYIDNNFSEMIDLSIITHNDPLWNEQKFKELVNT